MSEVPAHLVKALPWLEAAVAETQGTHTVSDVLAGIASGRLQLWVGEHCFAVTEFITFPQRRAFNVFVAGGEPGKAAKEALTLQAGLEAFARAGGATLFTHQGKIPISAKRKPAWWERIGHGFKATHIAMSKELTP